MAEIDCKPRERLPGDPRRKLVKDVRHYLSSFGVKIKPQLWIDTWDWAYASARHWAGKTYWPIPSEIAAQYVFLMLVKLRNDSWLKLPRTACDGKNFPARLVNEYLPKASHSLLLTFE